jgi:hypothetical protein
MVRVVADPAAVLDGPFFLAAKPADLLTLPSRWSRARVYEVLRALRIFQAVLG